jgi:uracil-DNA glycosylase
MENELLAFVEKSIERYNNQKEYHHENMLKLPFEHPEHLVEFASRERCKDFLEDLKKIKELLVKK